jgi:hypothetical protein
MKAIIVAHYAAWIEMHQIKVNKIFALTKSVMATH